MFKIYEFRYKDRNSGLGFVFYARSEVFADRLASRITALGMYSLQRRKAPIVIDRSNIISSYIIPIDQALAPYYIQQVADGSTGLSLAVLFMDINSLPLSYFAFK